MENSPEHQQHFETNRPFRQSDDWVRMSLIATVITVAIGTVGFAIQLSNLTRLYEQRQTTVEVKLQSIAEDLVELKSRIDK